MNPHSINICTNFTSREYAACMHSNSINSIIKAISSRYSFSSDTTGFCMMGIINHLGKYTRKKNLQN